ncbi:hypothetical protein BJ085DRAFT_36145 [Dimargaris cristalligena]|uniref:Pentacotripeptide-repeat region of PRORP domain-containing protein n=1 Tax=Dimargaris cristalligena TaxID=215637 RepID=A0A4P9ZJ32_9FUNG|nr:hypothetical protein BJ085DRAFT_36145 [Dimargaris cristalligena]|eukprot:RKP33236.1 hypothetical protein BJ085DRAFT_36145 [Dimargaris cristalligena]
MRSTGCYCRSRRSNPKLLSWIQPRPPTRVAPMYQIARFMTTLPPHRSCPCEHRLSLELLPQARLFPFRTVPAIPLLSHPRFGQPSPRSSLANYPTILPHRVRGTSVYLTRHVAYYHTSSDDPPGRYSDVASFFDALIKDLPKAHISDPAKIAEVWDDFLSFSAIHWQAYQNFIDPEIQQAHFGALICSQKRAAPAEARTHIMRILYLMRDLGVPLTKSHYSALLYTICRMGLMADALALFRELRVDASDNELLGFYHILLYGFGLNRNFNGLMDTYFQVLRDGLTPQALTYHIMIRSFQSEQDTFRTIRIFNSMMNLGIPANLLMARNMVFFLVAQQKYQEALIVFDYFAQYETASAAATTAVPEPIPPPAPSSAESDTSSELGPRRDIYLLTALLYCTLKTRDIERAHPGPVQSNQRILFLKFDTFFISIFISIAIVKVITAPASTSTTAVQTRVPII